MNLAWGTIPAVIAVTQKVRQSTISISGGAYGYHDHLTLKLTTEDARRLAMAILATSSPPADAPGTGE